MSQAISAAEASRQFPEILRRVREGESYIITYRGKPIARLEPVDAPFQPVPGAKERLLARIREQPALNAGPWTREELYER